MFRRLRECVLQALDENARAAGSLLELVAAVPLPESGGRGGNGVCVAPTPVHIRSGTAWHPRNTDNEDGR